MEVEDAEAAGEEFAGATAPLARRAGAWNRHDDAAVAGILAAARAAGASGAAVRYGGVVTKVWFEPHGSTTDLEAVSKKLVKLQLATAQSRIDELERRAAGASSQAKKERARKKQQKAAKRSAAGLEEQQRRAQQREAATNPTQSATAQQLAHAAQLHAQRSTAAMLVAEPGMGTSRSEKEKEQPAHAPAPVTSAQQPTTSGGIRGTTSSVAGGASAAPAAWSSPDAMDVMKPGEGCRTG